MSAREEHPTLVPQGIEQRVKSLEQQVAKLRSTNRDLERRCFDATQRGQQLASDLGFNDIADAEDAVSERPQFYNRATVEFNASQVEALERDLRLERERRDKDASLNHELLSTIARLRGENEDLKRREVSVKAPYLDDQSNFAASSGSSPTIALSVNSLPPERPHADASPSKDLSALLKLKHEELIALRERYDALLESHKRSRTKHKTAMVAWKKMKNWMFNQSLKGREFDTDALDKEDAEDSDDEAPSYDASPATLDPPASVVKIPVTPRKPSLRSQPTRNSPRFAASSSKAVPLSQNIINSPRLNSPSMSIQSPSIHQSSSRRTRLLTLAELGMDEKDGSPLRTSLLRSFAEVKHVDHLASPHRSIQIRREGATIVDLDDDSQMSTSTHRKLPLTMKSVALKRKHDEMVDVPDTRSDVSRTQTDSQALSLHMSQIPSQPSPSRRARRDSFGAVEELVVSSSRNRRDIRPTSNDLQHPSVSKRPRYSKPARRRSSASEPESMAGPSSAHFKTINAEYEVNSAANNGLGFQFDEVVRNKKDRQALDAVDCEDCRDYYEAVGPLPPRLQAPAWRTPPSSPAHRRHHHSHHHHPPQSIKQHQQEISRHRAQWARPPTPPGYWNIGFPDTQEASLINARATEMHRRKHEQVAQEARRDGGRYRKRA